MNEIIQKRRDLPFEYVDQQVEIICPDSKTRRFLDIVIWIKKNTKAACSIELKVPQGWSPYEFELFNDALQKAMYFSPQIPYFGTWNTNELVLWQTYEPDATSIIDRRKARYDIVKIKDLKEINSPINEQKFKQALERFLLDLADFYNGKNTIPKMPIDEFFINNLRSAVDSFYIEITNEIQELYNTDKTFHKETIKWIIEQGWLPPTSTEDFEKIARQYLYLIIDKIMFYNTLKLKYTSLKPIKLSDKIKKSSELKKDLQLFLTEATRISRDYETIFTPNYIETMPIPDSIAPRFISFINGFSLYDFSKLGLKDIGKIFDSLIPDNERYNLGQYFTNSDVVDLINGFCIRKPDDKVADFGCGAGTFLVRGYARLNYLMPKTHKSLLTQLWGVDIAKFPAHLSTINLAKLDLNETENYPKILCEDFFDVELGKKFSLDLRSI